MLSPIDTSIASILSHSLSVDASPVALVVDDDASIRAVCRQLLEAQGWLVHEVPDGQSAVACFEDFKPDVVLVDLNMPGLDGLQTTSRLRPTPASEDVPIIMLTGDADAPIVLEGLEAGADGYIEKPIREREFNLRLRSLTRLRRAWRAMHEGRALLGEQTRSLSLLLDFSMALSHKEDLHSILQKTIEVSAEMTTCQRVSIMLPDQNGEYLFIAASMGIPDQIVNNVRMEIGRSIAGRVFATGQPVLINNQEDATSTLDPSDVRLFEGLPMFSTPMRASEKIVGVMNLTARIGNRPFDVSEQGFINLLTNYAATAIQSNRSRKARDEARDSIVVALAKLAEHRDDDTGTHLDRVTRYCLRIAHALKNSPIHAPMIDSEFLHNLERAAPLHDIGKVAIPDAILLKPGKLNMEEIAVMRTHTRVGAETLRSLRERSPDSTFLKMAEEIAENHHEWFNGSGYPSGKRGDEIPLAARIVAVADVYDALTTKRVYKDAMSHRKALEIIVSESGSHFDPDLVKAFLKVEVEFELLAKELADAVDPDPLPIEQQRLRQYRERAGVALMHGANRVAVT